MALVACDDCGHQVSEAATACPSCGRPNDERVGGNCPNCHLADVETGTGLHGFLEITATIVWGLTTLLVGVLIYFALSARAWCPACGKRPNPVSPILLGLLLAVGCYVLAMVVALVAGGSA